MLALHPAAVDFDELDRADTPWFSLPGTTGHDEGPRGATADFSLRMVDHWAATIAEELLLLGDDSAEPDSLPSEQRAAGLLRGSAQPACTRFTLAPAAAVLLDQMRPAQLQRAVKRGAPVFIPVGRLAVAGGQDGAGGGNGADRDSSCAHLPCGAGLLAAQAVCGLAAAKLDGVVAPRVTVAGTVMAGTPGGSSAPFLRAVAAGLRKMGFRTIVIVSAPEVGSMGDLGVEGLLVRPVLPPAAAPNNTSSNNGGDSGGGHVDALTAAMLGACTAAVVDLSASTVDVERHRTMLAGWADALAEAVLAVAPGANM